MHKRQGKIWLLGLIIAACAVVGIALGFLLTNIQKHQDEADLQPNKIVKISDFETDASIWGKNYPRQYSSFVKTEQDSGRTPFGGSTPYSKLDEKPFLKKAWAGYAFSLEYNEERGHFYAQIDQAKTKRTTEKDQPGACVNCHTAELPELIKEMGWDKVNKSHYNDLRSKLHTGLSCSDCHDNKDMTLKITRPAFMNAMKARGIDLSKATHQEMRTYVCAQCHVEYYFKGDAKTLTFPWTKGLSIENIDQYYQETGHTDWTHKITGGKMLKMQHPDYELYSSGIHAKNNVACADCHMPYTREGAQKVSDHWIRSPLKNINNACQTCHKVSEKEIYERVINIQEKTRNLEATAEEAISDAIDAIKKAKDLGANDNQLQEAYTLHRQAQMRWDFIDAESSMGFHSPQEAARVLGHSIDLARQAQIKAINLGTSLSKSN
ncbi:MAG: ammonia-forming cytochrome c nitrite reductase subunit c552 [Deinococcaceae bacterium]